MLQSTGFAGWRYLLLSIQIANQFNQGVATISGDFESAVNDAKRTGF
jgi:hypothetical protein